MHLRDQNHVESIQVECLLVVESRLENSDDWCDFYGLVEFLFRH